MLRCALWVLMLGLTQIPESEKLSPDDQRGFQAEIQRLEQLKTSAADKYIVSYALARTFAFGGQYRQAIETLQDVIEVNAGLDPSRDRAFKKIQDTREFRFLAGEARAATPPIIRSKQAFTIAEADLVPEGIAYDPAAKQFYLGSTTKKKIIRCSAAGQCETFVSNNLGEVLGMKIDSKTNSLWTTSNSEHEAALLQFDLHLAASKTKHVLTSGRHEFNDLVVTKSGDVYVTDTPAGKVFRADHESNRLEELPLKIEGANGIALSGDESKLYIAGFPDGITVFDPASQTSKPIARPADLCLATIDGLYFDRGNLIAIQNGPIANRIIRMSPAPSLDRIDRYEILERRNPIFDGITTGAVAGDGFYFMANTQLDGPTDGKYKPIVILRLPL